MTLLVISVHLLSSCILHKSIQTNDEKIKMKKIDVQGHRGCRGLLPENTIPAFMKALELGVTTLELDLVISKDDQVIISHEPFFNHEITTYKGKHLKEKNEKKHNIYKLNRNDLNAYDVGLKDHPKFKTQESLAATKPTLVELAESTYNKCKEINRPLPYFNVEIKRVPEQDGEFHPGALDFARLVIKAIYDGKIQNNTYIQSFDPESLESVRKLDDSIPLVLLIANKKSPKKNLKNLSFIPEVYSPHHKLVDKELVELCARNNMKLIPWTVNEKEDIIKQLQLGVDGIITDYPDLLLEIIRKQENYEVLQ